MIDILESILGRSFNYTYLVALLVIVITYMVYICFIWPRISPLRALPGPSYCLPFFGSFAMLKVLCSEGYQTAQSIHEEYGPLSRHFRLGGHEYLLVTGASELAAIFSTHKKSFDRSEDQSKILKPLGIGNGLLSTCGSEHDIMRRLLNPAFNINTIKGLIPKFTIHANRLLDYWTKLANCKEEYIEICIQDDISKMTLDVIMDCAFGYKNHSCLEFESPINKAMNNLIRASIIRFEMVYPFVKYLPLKINRIRKESSILVEETIKKIITQKKEKGKIDIEETGSLDLLDRLLLVRDDDGSMLSDKELYEHTITFMFAGYETTSTALVWVLQNLAQHPSIQQRLRQEILSIIPDRNADITWTQLDKMPYLNSVIMESLRRRPSVPVYSKVSLEDVVIGGYVIPANTICNLWTGVAQTSKDYWDEPEKFNPEQFLDSEKKKKILPGSCLPFGSGKNMCIGYKFALTEMKVFLIKTIRDLVFSTIPGFKFKTQLSFTTYASPLLKLRVKKYDTN